MEIYKIEDDVYEVTSETNSSRTYFVSWGREGDFWSCTCTGWATSRNRAGGIGFLGKCKHVTLVAETTGRPQPGTVAAPKPPPPPNEEMAARFAELARRLQ